MKAEGKIKVISCGTYGCTKGEIMEISKSDMYNLLVASIGLSGSARRTERNEALNKLNTIRAIGTKYKNEEIRVMSFEASEYVDQCRWQDLNDLATDLVFVYLKIRAEVDLERKEVN